MNKIILNSVLLSIVSILISCNQNRTSQNNSDNKVTTDSIRYESEALEFCRDTLIGKFDGVHIDTLIAEPVGQLENDYYPAEGGGEWYYNWRVYTTGGTVKELTLEHRTVGIHFVEEGDLNGDGTDEWGFITEWPTSSWMIYYTFTFCDGYWSEFIPPFSVWLPHIEEMEDTVSGRFYYNVTDLVSKGNSNKTVHIKLSDERNDGVGFLQIDTIISIPDRKHLR